jgi:hypothetical protein
MRSTKVIALHTTERKGIGPVITVTAVENRWKDSVPFVTSGGRGTVE